MTPDIVVDIGNSRMKWGRCDLFETGPRTFASLPTENNGEWEAKLAEWKRPTVRAWAVASVHPERLNSFAEWVRTRGERLLVIDDYRRVPIEVAVLAPEKVGIDRLMNAVAAKLHLVPGVGGIVVSAGTAITVDFIDGRLAFVGGAILPGPRLMFDSLHRHTAKLPLIEAGTIPAADPLGKDTRAAITAGVMAAQIGAVEYLVREYTARCHHGPPKVLLTGGALGALAGHEFPGIPWVATDPTLTLQGIQLTAEAQPTEGSL